MKKKELGDAIDAIMHLQYTGIITDSIRSLLFGFYTGPMARPLLGDNLLRQNYGIEKNAQGIYCIPRLDLKREVTAI